MLLDLPLQDREALAGTDLQAFPPEKQAYSEKEPYREKQPYHGEVLFQEPSSPSSGRRFGVGLLVAGLIVGFGGGFFVGQRVAPPSPRPSAAQVAAPGPVRDAPVPPAQKFTDAPVVARPPTVEVQEPEVQPSVARPTAPGRANMRGGDPAPTNTAPGSLHIASRPAGAQVYVDEARAGTTPMTMNDVKPGAYRIRIELPGHRPWTTSVNVEAGAQARVGASLE